MGNRTDGGSRPHLGRPPVDPPDSTVSHGVGHPANSVVTAGRAQAGARGDPDEIRSAGDLDRLAPRANLRNGTSCSEGGDWLE